MRSKKTKKLLKIFSISVAITLVMSILVGASGVMVYNTFIYQEEPTVEIVTDPEEKEDVIGKEEEAEEPLKEVDKRIQKTVAILGTDFDGLLTDTIMVMNINSVTNKVNVISIPRDTQVRWTEEQRAFLPSRNKWVEVSKINEMTAWGGGVDNVKGLTLNQIERVLGVKVDNYVVVSLSAFRDIVDAIGGVEVDVPQRMYKEEVNGGLCIDLYPGVQILDGNKAEQFVRYRDYRDGDLGRIRAQQQFVEAFAKKVISPQIIAKIPSIVSTLITSVKTDVKLTELIEYYPYINQLTSCDVTFYMAPGVDRRENGISYYFIDREAMNEMVDELFFMSSN